MKEIVSLINNLDSLDKKAWGEMIDHAESKTQEKLETAVAEGQEDGMKVLEEILPLVKMVRLGLALDTIPRIERCRLVSIIIAEVSGLLSPVELVGVCFTAAFKCLCTSQKGATMPIAIPFPFGVMELEKKDETRSVV